MSGKELAGEYPVVLTVDRGSFRLSLFKDLKRVRVFPIAVGQAGLETPAGLYKIQNKAVNPAWHVPNSDWAGSLAGTVIPGGASDNPIKTRWLRVYDAVGVHGTDARGSIGSTASHGCIRMLVEDVEKLYDEVPVGTRSSSTDRGPQPRPISGTGISSQPECSSRAWCGECRMTSVPMKTPRSRLRITAYHIVVASPVPWMRSHGRGGPSSGVPTPASTSWRPVATVP